MDSAESRDAVDDLDEPIRAKKRGGKSKRRRGNRDDEDERSGDAQSVVSQSVRSGGDRFGRTKGRKVRTGAVGLLNMISDRNAGKPKRANGGEKVNSFRDICASFQQVGLKIRKIRQETTAGFKNKDVMPKKKF